MKNVVHKREIKPNTNIYFHKCGDYNYISGKNPYQSLCCSSSWKKVTCKNCLELRKRIKR